MCSENVARWFRHSYPVIAVLSTIVCLYSVSSAPPLHAEFFYTVTLPINGTIQIVKCDLVPNQVMEIIKQPMVPMCKRVVDQPKRLSVTVYHMSMGMPFLVCCVVGAVFCTLTKKADSNLFSMDTLFITETYDPTGQVCVCVYTLFLSLSLSLS